MDLIDDLKEYFDNTPQEQIERDWEETKEPDVTCPTLKEYFAYLDYLNREDS